MNLYFLGILAALVVFFAVGIGAGRMVKDTNDYYVSGRMRRAADRRVAHRVVSPDGRLSATRARSTPAFSSAS
ncbi:MAG: hypothetical protein ACLTG4_00705 [Oscillospiraceae bacterium]